MLDHAPWQFWLGTKRCFLRLSRGAATPAIGDPFFGKVRLAINQRRTLVARIAEKHANLDILDTACRTRVLALDPNRMLALLQKARLDCNPHRIGIASLFQYIIAELIPRSVCIPTCPIQQMLYSVRCRFAHPVGQLLAALPLTMTQHTLKPGKTTLP